MGIRLGRGLLAATMAMTMILSACSTAKPAAQDPAKPATQEPAKPKESSIEIFSWWTGGGEAAGLDGLLKSFSTKYPEIKVQNAAVAGGAGSNAKAVLASRMTANDPPDTFQVHAGHELLDTWVLAGKMESLNDLYKSEGWDAKFPKGLIDMMSKDGQVYSVAVNIHRSNVLWYNTKIFADNNLKAPTTFEEFFKVADALKAKGITPLALGDKGPWTAVHLFESVLLGTLGPEGYGELFNGKRKWDDAKVKEALETYKRMISYTNSDHAAREWQDASQLVAQGKAAMNVMGDWAKGYFTSDLKLVPNKDFGWVPSPGTAGTFLMLSDSFGLPKGVKHKDEVVKFLKLLGSVEGQDIFNPLKGSIPARMDADKSKYDEYGKSAMADWSSNKLAPSIAHGAAASPGFSDKLTDVIALFTTSGNVDQALQGLKAASAELK